ncbi:hypothetical protein EXIGLDRAFT_727045 [Exidia glandulosa HHB12029]|uniref:Uncharacterized protein n=1 Tax=Exidia glandulosa HHB12029 TaxID=1314781 RepID=A0A165DHM3_EXIGL|nr:hypothetical protein EXIGLDRAFT_727045 [Exidia glandulosa HHB12029]
MRARYLNTRASSYEHFFRHTSGRWIHDEQRQLAMRYRRFDVDALKSRVLACTGADGVEDVQKLDEGRCNKVFRVKLRNARDVIARIPTPMAGPAHLVTASEVATMDFLRNRLKLHQVPRVLSSSSRAADTPVGAEYIIMDPVEGVALRDVWNDLTMHQKIGLVDKWIKFESVVVKAMRMSGGVYGSLYYRKDLPSADARDIIVDGVKDDEFVIGPCVQSLFWEKEDNYDTLDFDRGSWTDNSSFLRSLSARERAWIKQYAVPTKFVTPFDLPLRLQQPDAHLRLLDQYDSIADYFIPKDPRLLEPAMVLFDSNWTNIFLSREALDRGEIEISGVIDWQHTAILPLYMQAQIPVFLSDAVPAPGQDWDEFRKERDYLIKAYHALYFETGVDVVWASVLTFGENRTFAQDMPALAASCWRVGYVPLKRRLIRVFEDWENIGGPDIPCPLIFSPDEIAQQKEDDDTWLDVEAAREDLDAEVGVVKDWVPDDDSYDRAVQANNALRNAWVATVKREDFGGHDPAEFWPYKTL